jgi:hypothetical protein
VVAVEPYFRDRSEVVIVRDLIGWKVTVVVDDRLGVCVLVKEHASRLGLEQEVVVENPGRGHGRNRAPIRRRLQLTSTADERSIRKASGT